MTYQQVRDVIERICYAQRRLRLSLEQPDAWITDERTRLIFHTLEEEEQSLQEALARFGAEGEPKVLDTWIQFVADEQLDNSLDSIEFDPGMSADEVVAEKQKFDQALAELLEQLKNSVTLPRVEELFSSLLQHVETRSSQQAWQIREYQDHSEPPH